MHEITSRQNPKFKLWLSLLEAKGLRANRLALLSGEKLIREFIERNPSGVKQILLPPKAPVWSSSSDLPQTRLSALLFKELDVIGTKTALAVVDTPSLQTFDSKNPPRGLELVLALSDPGNLGACLRSAEAFGVQRVILTRECSHPFLPKALRASSGSSLRLQLFETGAFNEMEPSKLLALDMEGESLIDFHWPKDIRLVVGEEGQGLPEGWNGRRIRIPMQSSLESLNATVAVSIALYAHAAQSTDPRRT